MAETIPLKDTVRLGTIARKADPDGGEDQASAPRREVQWERYIARNPDAPARVERVTGFLPWTHAVEFENDGVSERWLLRSFAPLTRVPE